MSRIKWIFLVLGALSAPVFLVSLELSARITPPQPCWAWDATNFSQAPLFRESSDGSVGLIPEMARLDNKTRPFRRRKQPGSYRIICLGASSTAGWPYHPRGGFPERLQAYLSEVVPERSVEVINLGLHRLDTERVASVARQALAWEPDILVLQTGHNDYYSLSVRRRIGLSAGLHYWLVLNSGLYNALLRLQRRPPETAAGLSEKLQTVDERRRTLETYSKILASLLDDCSAAGIPVILSELPFSVGSFGESHPLPSEIFPAMNAALKNMAERRKMPLLQASDLERRGHLLDSIHPDAGGYALLARRLLKIICDGSLRGRCRLETLKADGFYEERLGLREPAFARQLHVRLGSLRPAQ